MNKFRLAIAIISSLGAASPASAQCYGCGYYGGYGYGGGFAGDLLGGAIGGLVAGAIIAGSQQQQSAAPLCTAPNGSQYYARVINGVWRC